MNPSPKRGQIYTFEEMTRLDLDDSPHLCFTHEGKSSVIQDSCATNADMLSIPGFAQSKWKYRYTTHECIPIFQYVGEEPITTWVTIEENLRAIDEDDQWWATFILFPQPQY